MQCGCGRRHTATRPDGARSGPVGYGPNLAAFAVYLMVVHFVPAHRVVALLESLTGTAPSVGFVHGMINRRAGLLEEVHQRIRALITLAYAVCCDETPLRVGPKQAPVGKKKAERHLLVAATTLYTHYLLGDRSLATFTAFVVKDLAASGSVIVHDRHQYYDSAALGPLVHQLCTAHLLRDLDDAAQVYPDTVWPTQIADALRELIGAANSRAWPRSRASTVTCCCAGCATGGWSGCPTPSPMAPAPGNARPGYCWRSYASARATCCASPTT